MTTAQSYETIAATLAPGCLLVRLTKDRYIDKEQVVALDQDLTNACYALPHDQPIGKIIVDWAGVQFSASEAVAAFKNLRALAKTKKMSVVFCCIKPEILELYQLLNLIPSFFQVFPDQTAAIQS